METRVGGSNNASLNDAGFYLHQGSYRVGSTTVIDSSRNLTNIGNITSTGKTIIGDGTTYAQSTDYLYIGGNGLSSSDAAIYIGNRGNATGHGWRLFYEGTGTGTNNKFIIKSENGGSAVDALSFTTDGAATFASSITSTGASTFGSIKTDLIQREGDGLSSNSFLDFDMDTGGCRN